MKFDRLGFRLLLAFLFKVCFEYDILLNFGVGKRSIIATLPYHSGLVSNQAGPRFGFSILLGKTHLIKCATKHNQKEEKAESCREKMLDLKSKDITQQKLR